MEKYTDFTKIASTWVSVSGGEWSASSVRVWGDRWLYDSNNPYVETPIPAGFEDFKVGDLIMEGKNEWDREAIHYIMSPRDAQIIYSM